MLMTMAALMDFEALSLARPPMMKGRSTGMTPLESAKSLLILMYAASSQSSGVQEGWLALSG